MSNALSFATSPRTIGAGIALGRVVLGAAAIAKPALPAKPWIGAGPAAEPGVQVFARALGGRDIALGVLALASGGRTRRLAVGLGAMADAVDMSATLLHWKDLPPRDRWGILAVTAGAAGLGTWAALR
ncbi:MAG: hypothetical protein ACT4QF_00810 [Sporichthyaceae bacterium]